MFTTFQTYGELGLKPKRFVKMGLSYRNYAPAVMQGAEVDVATAADFSGNVTIGDLVSADTLTLTCVTTAVAGTSQVVFDVTGTTLTTGKVLDVSDLAGLTTGTIIHIDATGVTQTSGKLIHLDSASTALTSTGRLFLSDFTGATTTSGILNEFKSASTDETIIVQIYAVGAAALGTCLNVKAAAMTTGVGIKIDSADALTTGILVDIESGATAMTTSGRLLSVDHSGATSTTGTLVECKSAATDETKSVVITASGALAAGACLDIVASSMTTGVGIRIDNADALTTGVLVDIESAATAIATTGRMFRSDHSGATSTSGVLNEFLSAATDETVIVQITASGVLSTGIALNINTASMTDGTAIYIDGTAISGGTGIDLSTIPVGQMTIDFPDGNVSSIDPSATAENGWINIGVAGALQYVPYYDAS